MKSDWPYDFARQLRLLLEFHFCIFLIIFSNALLPGLIPLFVKAYEFRPALKFLSLTRSI